jgi:hypothetical protein
MEKKETWLPILIFLIFFFSEDQAKLAARKYARIVQKLGFAVSDRQVVNRLQMVFLVKISFFK